MFVRLFVTLPLDTKHGASAGRVFSCLRFDEKGRTRKAWFLGDAGEECAAYIPHEADVFSTHEAAEREVKNGSDRK